MKRAIYILVAVILLVGIFNFVRAQNYDDRADLINRFLEFADQDGDGKLAGFGSYRPNINLVELLGNLGGTATSSDAKARTYQVAGSRHLYVQCNSTETPVMTIKFKGSLANTSGNFDNTTNTTATSSSAEFIEVIDKENRGSIDGDTGVSISEAGTRIFEFNTNGLNWIYATTTSYTSGSSTCWFKEFTNS